MKLIRFCSVFFFVAISFSLNAAYTVKNGKLVNQDKVSTMSVQEHYSVATEAYLKSNWAKLVQESIIINKNFPSTPFAQEALFYLGVGYFHLKDYEMANKYFSSYLKKQTTPKHFEEAIQYKFSIAEKFDGGAKKHLLGLESMPKWVPAREEALEIYEEVITALPHHDLAAQALFGKARLLVKDEDYKSSIEAFQTLIRRFPKNPLAPESYIGIAEVYLKQCQSEYPDPDFLDLAEINLRKFRRDFPGEEKLKDAEKILTEMQEVYAHSLYDTGRFFERTNKSNASLIYYSKVIAKYPHTKVADLSQKRIDDLTNQLKKRGVKKNLTLESAPSKTVEELSVSSEELFSSDSQSAEKNEELTLETLSSTLSEEISSDKGE